VQLRLLQKVETFNLRYRARFCHRRRHGHSHEDCTAGQQLFNQLARLQLLIEDQVTTAAAAAAATAAAAAAAVEVVFSVSSAFATSASRERRASSAAPSPSPS